MKIVFDVKLPRILGSKYHVPVDQIITVLESDEAEIKRFIADLKITLEKDIFPFNELEQAITGLQIAPVKRDKDDSPVLLSNGMPKSIPFTPDQHKQNSEILAVLYVALDKVEETGKNITTMRDSVEVEMKPKQVKYLAIRIDRICKEFNTTGQHVVDFTEKWEAYKAEALALIKAK